MLNFGILCVLVICVTGQESCGPNEVYTECGSGCAPTCGSFHNRKRAVMCAAVCLKGCFCKPGFVKDIDGSCVQPSNCNNIEKVCGLNEVYGECGSGCAETCDTYYNRKPPVMCAAVCVKGCFCAPGFIKDIDGSCVKPDNCTIPQNVCGPNEAYTTCGSGCATTCDTFYNRKPPVACAYVCLEGCFCAPGFIKDIDGSCVEPSNCKIPEMRTQCSENEEIVPCAKPNWCNSCGLRGNCKLGAGYCKDGGCDCKTNHFRDVYNNCIPEEQCPKQEQCQENETYYDYKPDCYNTCENWGNPRIRCSSGPPGCFCKEGLVKRKGDGACVKYEDCNES